nr:MAG TPA: hypothetical protein [Caudoviricetes sp.]
MKKLIKLDFNNTTRERKTEDSYSELYSHDKNNGSFEFEILNDTLTTEQVIALFKFTESNKIWKTTGTVEGNKVKVTFDTSLITQNETVICYLYFDEEQRTSDTFRFKFKVKVSEIDKMSRYEVKERFINNTVIVDRLDVVTKDELKEALKNVGGIATEGLLTEVKAEEIYAKKSEAVDNTNFELVKNRVLALELKTDKDTIYDDSELKGRISVLEAREDNNTIYDDTNVRERLTALESKPNVDVNNLVTKDELASKNYLTEHQDTSNFALKSEIPQQYNDTEVKERLTTLENKPPVDLSNYATKEELRNISGSQPTVDTSHLVTRDELESKGYATDLSEYAKKSELYNDSDLKARVEVLEQKTDKDTVYDDTPLKERLTALETKEDKDTKYDDTEVKHRLTELENKPAVDTSVFVTDEKLNSKGYLTSHQDLTPYALKSEIPQPYNDTPLKERVEVLETKVDKDTVYNDTELRNRVEVLENKPNVDLTNYVTTEQLENKHYLTQHQSLDNLVTKEELNSKGYVTEGVLNGKNYLTEDVLSTKNYLTQHQDLSSLVTKQELENKHYLTEHQPLTHLATTSDLEVLRNISVNKAELSKKLDTTEFTSFKDSVVTKTELAEKGYLTSHQDLSEYALKSEIPQSYSDTDLRNRVVALENRPTGGGTQVQDTGWIKLSDETMTAGSIVEIRRIDNTVNVRFRNEQGNHFIVNPQIENNTILSKQISTGFGSVVNNSLMILSENKGKSLGVVSTEINNGNLQITIHIANSDYSNEFGVSVYVNEFTYITDEPFPTNLH